MGVMEEVVGFGVAMIQSFGCGAQRSGTEHEFVR